MIDIESASFDCYNDTNTIYNFNQNKTIKKYNYSLNMPYILNDIELHVKRGNLIFVIGKNGAGKSSLLNSILGEMLKLYGYIGVRGNISYFSKKPWLFNGTIRNNILLNFDGINLFNNINKLTYFFFR